MGNGKMLRMERGPYGDYRVYTEEEARERDRRYEQIIAERKAKRKKITLLGTVIPLVVLAIFTLGLTEKQKYVIASIGMLLFCILLPFLTIREKFGLKFFLATVLMIGSLPIGIMMENWGEGKIYISMLVFAAADFFLLARAIVKKKI